jgi:gliding motility-associated-like protein
MKSFPAYIRIVRKAAIIGLMLLSVRSFAQFDCTILCNLEGDTVVFENDTTVCYKQKAYLFTQFADTLNYSWEPGGETGVIIEIQLKDTTKYILTVFNDDSSFMCKDSITLNIYPKIEVTFEQISKGCPDECKAQVKAEASGGFGPPYSYYWSAIVAPNDSSMALGLCTESTVSMQVRDTICAYDTTFLVEGYTMPEIEITMVPDSLFDTNPQADFSFENKSADSIPLSNWTWIFPDSSSTNLLTPKYVFTETDSVMFIYETIDGCIDTMYITATVQEFKIQIFNVFTPNGDGVNDFYEIPNLERYISNELVVFNRWGERVFEATNYRNNWDGGNLPDGVYYYILRCQGYWEEDVFKGSVSIYGSGH